MWMSPPSYEEATAGPRDAEMLTGFGWDDRNIRRVFIRKYYIICVPAGVGTRISLWEIKIWEILVYTIIMIQLLVTLAIVVLFTFCEPVKIYIHANPGWYWASYVLFFITYLTLSCCAEPRRRFPWNLLLLVIFTLCLSYMTGMLSSFYNTKSVMICLGITALVCLSVTIFSFQTKIDVTSCQGVLFVLCMVVFFSGLIFLIVLPFGYVPWLHAVYAALGALAFSVFLAFDTQLLMGSKHYSISPEEYVFAALNIYLDIVYIFTFILQLFGSQHD